MSEKYKEGLNRNQQLLFPPSLDEYVDENNPVRAIDDYVSSLDLYNNGVGTMRSGTIWGIKLMFFLKSDTAFIQFYKEGDYLLEKEFGKYLK